MNLQQLLTALKNNTSLNITLIDSSDKDMITFNAAGYENIENDLNTRIVTNIQVDSNKLVRIKIADA